jgi:hypothetical protein
MQIEMISLGRTGGKAARDLAFLSILDDHSDGECDLRRSSQSLGDGGAAAMTRLGRQPS